QAADDTEPVLVEGAVAGLARARDGIGRRLRRAVPAAFAVRLDDRLALVILVAGERPVHHLGPHAAVTGAGLIRLPSGRLAGASPPHRYSLNRCRAPDVGPVAVSKAAHAVGPVVPAAVTLSITSVPLVRLCSGRGPSGVACTARRTVRRTAVVRAAATPSDAVSASRRSAPPEECRGGKRRWAGRFRACGRRWTASVDRGGDATVIRASHSCWGWSFGGIVTVRCRHRIRAGHESEVPFTARVCTVTGCTDSGVFSGRSATRARERRCRPPDT